MIDDEILVGDTIHAIPSGRNLDGSSLVYLVLIVDDSAVKRTVVQGWTVLGLGILLACEGEKRVFESIGNFLWLRRLSVCHDCLINWWRKAPRPSIFRGTRQRSS